MSTVLSEHDSSAGIVTDEFREVYRLYREQFGPAYFDDRLGALSVRAGRVCALMTTARRGARVHMALDLRPIPIITIDNSVWAFITGPRTLSDDIAGLTLEMYRGFVTPVWPGTAIALPTPGNSHRGWECGPREVEIPTFGDVAHALTTVPLLIGPQPGPRHG